MARVVYRTRQANRVGLAGQERGRMERRLFLVAASPRARAQRRVLSQFVAGCLALTAFGIVAVNRTADSAATGYQVDRLASQVAVLLAENRSLRAEAAALSSAPRLEAVAHASGLVLPTEVVPIHMPLNAPRPRAQDTHTAGDRSTAADLLYRVARVVARFVSRFP